MEFDYFINNLSQICKLKCHSLWISNMAFKVRSMQQVPFWKAKLVSSNDYSVRHYSKTLRRSLDIEFQWLRTLSTTLRLTLTRLWALGVTRGCTLLKCHWAPIWNLNFRELRDLRRWALASPLNIDDLS